ncbi:MAG: hypothetical protein A2W61_00700 [Deltaproteobacteria bacterium RIFCSPLOWO2_01_44_7]|nr:MAG: hypothetical protein A2712_05860 [Deltaproteobacteria bacterium RIFCSPHIGHO2_01_FULL_43_49]OGQ16656.1 MAG: hypothetical protein A3D22_06985 [Deltaproteobacteria bacterium RIFCSPHIGHO2_02_FULL_44_53]OGQ29794.1 MAG: hypothetical protein A3D98_09650 [Deltaproteobacteria bacterium RIFCSPHIGHO2_12_FULL_44_21]OGQ33084.1 MAG: hypothetical protein A2979_03630 [Deltaproteobacteria bacterium RIFCSPLOWO2_01_FULL_45_74]OGQ37926.1 MAG: hypothetical protein A2W61_00700 [Deltaproteobacteria bacterium 
MKRFVFSVAAVFLMIVFVEGGLRIASLVMWHFQKEIEGKKDPYAELFFFIYKDKDWAKDHFKELEEAQKADYESLNLWIGQEFHGKYVNIDSRGLRKTWNPESFGGKEPKKAYVFGGSTIWGSGARDDYTIPSLLSKQLNAREPSYIVTNYGQGAYTFFQQIFHLLLLLREGQRPDYVIFYSGANDVLVTYQNGKADVTNGPTNLQNIEEGTTHGEEILNGIKGLLYDHSKIYRALLRIVTLFVPPTEADAAPKYDETFLTSLTKDFVEFYAKSHDLLDHLSKIYHFQYLSFWQPILFTKQDPTEEETKLMRDPRFFDNETLADLYRKIGRELPKKGFPHFFKVSHVIWGNGNSQFLDWCHLSEEGNEIIAKKMAEIFEKEFLK